MVVVYVETFDPFHIFSSGLSPNQMKIQTHNPKEKKKRKKKSQPSIVGVHESKHHGHLFIRFGFFY